MDQEKMGAELPRRIADGEAAEERSPRSSRVLPADLDLDEELDRRFAQPGVGVWVAVV
ncbi:MAG TPA: hypothetical protein VMK42_16215 [Anaeromyxobacteraceae bacterium]|nr:hypothetical protein [Anaeromyxobacteraceae bacterium]